MLICLPKISIPSLSCMNKSYPVSLRLDLKERLPDTSAHVQRSCRLSGSELFSQQEEEQHDVMQVGVRDTERS